MLARKGRRRALQAPAAPRLPPQGDLWRYTVLGCTGPHVTDPEHPNLTRQEWATVTWQQGGSLRCGKQSMYEDSLCDDHMKIPFVKTPL